MKHFASLLFLLILFQYICMDKEEGKEEPEYYNPKPDASRIPHHYDWDSGKYVYEDELPKPEPPLTPKSIQKPLPFKPDVYVEITPRGQGQAIKEEPDIIIGNKRYRQQKLANGDIKLIPIR